MCADAHGDQKRVLDPLGQELWADVSFLTCVLGAKLKCKSITHSKPSLLLNHLPNPTFMLKNKFKWCDGWQMPVTLALRRPKQEAISVCSAET